MFVLSLPFHLFMATIENQNTMLVKCLHKTMKSVLYLSTS